ncbi:hypothetical protein PROH_01920 [Prochlorothrix hollandica PCC 9006 = CALU 1027]|uniref:Uncharacterized protein n=1 Tax=Prochlorothrix hollandica PCC 9006 = CALU 1027 TaxID=317619 RepID=A0A0M2Q3J8_PROHO|nr:hypothetical protein PROH_01920 [Prochlorothrix hollandica PCC 9006 = CALU 1027]
MEQINPLLRSSRNQIHNLIIQCLTGQHHRSLSPQGSIGHNLRLHRRSQPQPHPQLHRPDPALHQSCQFHRSSGHGRKSPKESS